MECDFFAPVHRPNLRVPGPKQLRRVRTHCRAIVVADYVHRLISLSTIKEGVDHGALIMLMILNVLCGGWLGEANVIKYSGHLRAFMLLVAGFVNVTWHGCVWWVTRARCCVSMGVTNG